MNVKAGVCIMLVVRLKYDRPSLSRVDKLDYYYIILHTSKDTARILSLLSNWALTLKH
jgi:hypothetical protein